MTQPHRGALKYVYDLPYSERRQLCQILDQNDKWEELGGSYMEFNTLTIQSLRRETLRGKSPTDELLTKWGHQNHTILELFVLLSKMQHYQAMLTLKQFVDPEYHRLIYEGEQNLSRLFKVNRPVSVNGEPGPSMQSSHGRPANYKTEEVNMNVSGTSNVMPDKFPLAEAAKYEESERKILNVDYQQVEQPAQVWQGVKQVKSRTGHQSGPQSNGPSVIMRQESLAAGGHASGPTEATAFRDKNVSEASSLADSVGSIPLITFKELLQATNGWDQNTVLGKGGFGTVYKGIWKNTQVAIKRTRNPETDESHSVQIQQILGELKMLNSYRHDNILPLYGFSLGGEDPCLVYQFMPNGSLEDRLLCRQNTRPLSWLQRHNIATGTARGLQFLHTIGEKPLIHGDIKSPNILLDSNFEPKIGDFGLAREGPYNHYTHIKLSRVHGTRPYLPDEFLRHKKFSTKVDTHSFGIVLFELATGLRAYDPHREIKFLKECIENFSESQLETLVDTKCGPDEHQTFANLIALGKCCVNKKPKDRPEMPLVLKELDAMAVKRDMLVRVQSMIRQNSLTPTNPYEMQVLHDHLSQQRKLSPTPSHASNARSISPNASPVPLSSNPFLLPVDPSRSNNNSGGTSPLRSLSPNINNNVASGAAPVPAPSPAIAISPPSEHNNTPPSTSSSSSASPVDNPPTMAQNVDDDDYLYLSQYDTVLPLISELGIKGDKSTGEDGAGPSAATAPEPSCVVATSAKGKSLWIMEEST